MNVSQVSCSKCQAPVPASLFNLPEPVACPGCGRPLEIEVFPALFRSFAPGRSGEAVLEETESSCFYHPAKKAVVPCDACGRFLCALCDCELNGRHLCPGCLDTGRTKGKIQSLENHRVLYDSAALAVAIVPMLIVYFTLLTAPIALFLAFRYWKSPGSIVRRTKVRFVIAAIIACLELAGWAVVVALIFYFRPKRF